MIAYSRVYDPGDGFWIVADELNGNSRKLMRARDEYAGPSWSRKADWVAAAAPEGISIANTHTGEVIALTQNDHDTADIHPTWSPTEDRILFGRVTGKPDHKRGLLITIRPDGTDMRILTNDRVGGVGIYSADGALIAFTPDRTSTEYFGPVRTQVWMMNSDGSAQRQLTDDPQDSVVTRLRWIGRNRRLSFTRYKQTFALEVSSGEQKLLPSDLNYCAWSPDGIAAFVRDGKLYLAEPENFEPALLHVLGNVAWGVGDMAWSSQGKHLAAFGQRGDEAGMYVIDIAAASCRFVARAGSPAFAPTFP